MKIPQEQSKLLRKFAEVEIQIKGAVIASVTHGYVIRRKLRIGIPATISLDPSRDPVFRDDEWFFPVEVETEDMLDENKEQQYIPESLLRRII